MPCLTLIAFLKAISVRTLLAFCVSILKYRHAKRSGFPHSLPLVKNELEALPIGLRRLAEIPSNVSTVTFNERNSFLSERTISLVTGSGYLFLFFVLFLAVREVVYTKIFFRFLPASQLNLFDNSLLVRTRNHYGL